MTSMLTGVVLCVSLLFQATPFQEKGPPSRPLTEEAFQRAFEEAFDAGDTGRMEQLVSENPTRFVKLFENYAKVWIEVKGEPSGAELKALEKAIALAEAVDSALEAPGLLEMAERLESFGEEERQAWREGQEAIQEAEGARARHEWARAAEECERAIGLLEQVADWILVGALLNNLGLCYVSLGQYEKAIDYLEKALEIRERVGDPHDIASSLSNLGICYESLSQYEQSVAYHEKALEFRERLGNPQDVASSLNELGICYGSLGQYEQSVAYHEKALEINERLGNPQAIANSLNNLGICYDFLGEYEKAIDYYEKAIEIRERVGNPQDVASSFNNLGACCDSLGEYEKAIDYYEKAIEIGERVGKPEDIASFLAGLGSCYRSLGEYEKAIEYHEKALEIRERGGKPEDIACSLDGLGNCYGSLGQYEKGVEYHEKALEIAERVGNPNDVGRSFANLGCSYGSLGQYEKAIDCHEKALEIAERLGNPQDIGATVNNLGCFYQLLGQYEKAIDYQEKALEIKERLGNPQEVATFLSNLGLCYHSVGQHQRALDTLANCVLSLRRVGTRYLPEGGRGAFLGLWSFIPAVVTITVKSLSTSPEAEAAKQGFPLVEYFLGRTLLEGLRERASGVLQEADPGLAQAYKHALNRMEEIRLRLVKEGEKAVPDETVISTLRGDLEKAVNERDAVELRLRRESPRLKELVAPEPARLQDVQALLSDDEALLIYLLGQEASYVWVITDKGAAILELAAEAVLRQQYDLLKERLEIDAEVGGQSFGKPARELYKLLLAEAEAAIGLRKALLIVPDGFLGFVPFDVLLTRDAPTQELASSATRPYLLKEKTIRYVPSASFLVFLTQLGEERERAPHAKDLLLLGDPVYRLERERGELLAARSRAALSPTKMKRLEKTRDEVRAIAGSLLGAEEEPVGEELRELGRSGRVCGARFDLCVGDEASEGRLEQDLRGYRMIHLAVHGYFDVAQPWFSGVVLSDEGEGENSGFLNLAEIAGLKLDADLVFLSACETSQGKVTRAEGIRSAARSFILAGARSVVATLWRVDDTATSALAVTFYDNLFRGHSPSAALREAKLAMIEGRAVVPTAIGEVREASRVQWSAPWFWAPFVIWGR
ncbi:MAG: tetratricopeptide repeat protein [Planctomycetota bacterium]